MASNKKPAPPHVEETVAAVVRLHVEHHQRAGAPRRSVAAATALVSRPRTLAFITLAIIGWVAANGAVAAAGGEPFDRFPFPVMDVTLAAAGLYLATMILIVQRHDDELAERRAQLTLELAMLADRKSAKIIALLEAFRHRDPHQSDGRDAVAEALAEPADADVVLNAISSAQEKAAAPKGREGD